MKAVRFTLIQAILVLFVSQIGSICFGQELPFLKNIISARAAGMGQCTVNLVDQEAGFYNPGALGLFHLNRTVGLFFPIKSNYNPNFANDISPRLFGISLGQSFDINPASTTKKGVFGAALAYSRYKMALPKQPYFNLIGDTLGTEQYIEKSNNFSFAMGFDYWIRLGLGVTYKDAEAGEIIHVGNHKNAMTGQALDYGIIAELPLLQFFSKQENKVLRPLSFEINPSFAYVDANNGEHPKYRGTTSPYGLSHLKRTGLSILITCDQHTDRLGSVRLSSENENDLTSENNDISKVGAEFGLWDIVFLRAGNVKYEANRYEGSFSFNTYGAGLDLGVLLYRFYIKNHFKAGGSLYDGVVQNMSLTVDYSHYKREKDREVSAYGNTEFINIGLSF